MHKIEWSTVYWYVFFLLFFFSFAGFAVQFSFFRCARWFANFSLMRVCFNGLCSRRAAAVDEETQTVSDIHDTGGGGHINHVCDDSCKNIPALSDQRNQSDSCDTTDPSHKIHKNHCSASSTARSKLLSLLSLNNIDRKLFFLRTKMDSHDSPRVHQANSNPAYDIDLVNRNHSNNMVSILCNKMPTNLSPVWKQFFFSYSFLFYRPITIIMI